jgi:putative oxidoreductase
MSYGLLFLRLVVGGTMFSHGAQKLFGWFGGGGPRGTAGFLGQLGFRAPRAMAVLVGLAEASGLLFAAGFLTPLAALGIAVVMVNAIWTVHWQNGFFNGNGGFEFPLLMFSVVVAVAAIGPGRFSIDNAIHRADNWSGLWWGVGVFGLAVAISFLTITVGRKRFALTEAHAA